MRTFREIAESEVNESILKNLKNWFLTTFSIWNELKMDKLLDKARDKKVVKNYNVETLIKPSQKDNGFSFFTVKINGIEILLFIETKNAELIYEFNSSFTSNKDRNNLDYASLRLAPIEEMSRNGITPYYIVELTIAQK